MFSDIMNHNRLINIKNYIKTLNYGNKKELLNYIDYLIKNNISFQFSDNVLEELLFIYIDDSQITYRKFDTVNNFCNITSILYQNCYINENNNIELENFYKLCKLITKPIITEKYTLNSEIKILFISECYNLFSDKKNSLNVIQKFIQECYFKEQTIKALKEYLINSRCYYVDEAEYSYKILKTINFIKENNEEFEEYLKKQLEYDKHQAGVYEIGDAELNALATNIKNYQEELKLLNEKKINIINDLYVYKEQILREVKNIVGDLKLDTSKMNRDYDILTEQEDLLKIVKQYNENFKIITKDSIWFNKKTFIL